MFCTQRLYAQHLVDAECNTRLESRIKNVDPFFLLLHVCRYEAAAAVEDELSTLTDKIAAQSDGEVDTC